MRRDLITRHSEALGEDMSLIVYGDGGYPVVVFQVQDAKCNNFEDFGMIDLLSDYIEGGTLQLFSVDGIDQESWSDTWGDKARRAQRQEDYFRYVTDELIPLVHEINGTDRRPFAIGCSMGATHAAIAAFRRPDLFQGCIALSGVYDTKYFWGDWMDDVLYGNCITAFLPNMPADHPYVKIYAQRQLVLCVGQGAWEDQGIADLRIIRDTCRAKGIACWCDFWGDDVNHDWPWWRKQLRYFLPIVLDDLRKTMAEEAVQA
jgi:esterase/lipase superfamily enzyme